MGWIPAQSCLILYRHHHPTQPARLALGLLKSATWFHLHRVWPNFRTSRFLFLLLSLQHTQEIEICLKVSGAACPVKVWGIMFVTLCGERSRTDWSACFKTESQFTYLGDSVSFATLLSCMMLVVFIPSRNRLVMVSRCQPCPHACLYQSMHI